MRLLSLALVLCAACSSAPKTAEDPIELGRRLATDPRDWRAHRDMAKLRYAEGLWGEALREYLILERQDRLGAPERIQLGSLLVARAKARAEVADSGALEDLDRAKALGVAPGELLPRALELAAVAALRHSSAFTREEARAHLSRLSALVPGDAKTQQESLVGLDHDSVLTVFRWFQVAGAKRQALRVAEHYVQSGGRDPQVVDQWLELHRWWYGARRPPLPTEVAQAGQAALPPLERLAASLLPTDTASARKDVAQGLIDDWKIELWTGELAAIESAFRTEPARSDRLSREFVDSEVYGAHRLAVLAELFHRLGDSGRAKLWAIELAALSREVPAYSLAAGLACVIDGDVGPADQYFVTAAAASGDPGRYWAMAGRAFRGAGHLLPAVAANRRALALISPGRDLRILLELSMAQQALGRSADADRSLDALFTRVGDSQLEHAKLLVAQEQRRPPHPGTSLLGELRVELGF